MKIKPEFKKRDIRSFVIRGGRITEAQEKGIERFWPEYGLSLFSGLLDPSSLFNTDQPLVVEIGYGMGDSLLTMAKNEPDKNFIGIEVHPPGVGRLVNEAGKEALGNLKTYCADAVDVLNECIPNESVERLQIYFPDPWHKKRHHKRRIIQPEFIGLLEQKLRPGGVLHLATDWQPYAEHMLEVLQSSNLKNTEPDYSPRPSWRPTTKFEQRGQKLGHGVWDLIFQKS